MLQLVPPKHRRDEQKLPDFIPWDELPVLLGGVQEHLFYMVWDVGLSWAKVLSPAFQQLPRKCSCYYQDGKASFPCIPVRPDRERTHGGDRSEEQEPAQQEKICLQVETSPGPSLGIKHLYLIWEPHLSLIESHQDKVENFGK